jgi:hypothetical protein
MVMRLKKAPSDLSIPSSKFRRAAISSIHPPNIEDEATTIKAKLLPRSLLPARIRKGGGSVSREVAVLAVAPFAGQV